MRPGTADQRPDDRADATDGYGRADPGALHRGRVQGGGDDIEGQLSATTNMVQDVRIADAVFSRLNWSTRVVHVNW
jgi:hypothetical protein